MFNHHYYWQGILPDKDFYIRKGEVLLTREGRENVNKLRITGTKIPLFFSITYIDDYFLQKRETHFRIWAKINNFYVRDEEPKELRGYLENIESKLRAFVNEKTGKNFEGYSADIRNVFEDELFGGVPDGECLNAQGEVEILEIKTPDSKRFDINKLCSYLLQLGLYLYLRNVDTGYLCIADLGGSEKWEEKNERLRWFLEDPKEFEPLSDFKPCSEEVSLLSKIELFNNSIFAFDILESKRYVNGQYELHLLKIRIGMNEYSKIIENCKKWYWEYRYQSPKIDIYLDSDFVREVWKKIY